jgi:hypothetical protein
MLSPFPFHPIIFGPLSQEPRWWFRLTPTQTPMLGASVPYCVPFAFRNNCFSPSDFVSCAGAAEMDGCLGPSLLFPTFPQLLV